MAAMAETLRELGAAWLLWAENFLTDAAQLPYRRAVVIAFIVGAVLSWFAAREWFQPWRRHYVRAIRTIRRQCLRNANPSFATVDEMHEYLDRVTFVGVKRGGEELGEAEESGDG